MKQIFFYLAFALILSACGESNKATPPKAKANATKTQQPKGKPKNKASKPTNKIVSKEKNAYWANMQNKLQLTDAEIMQMKTIRSKYSKLRKGIDKNDAVAIGTWRKNKNAEYRKLLGVKRFRMKSQLDKELVKNK